jgi:hypothetical protein
MAVCGPPYLSLSHFLFESVRLEIYIYIHIFTVGVLGGYFPNLFYLPDSSEELAIASRRVCFAQGRWRGVGCVSGSLAPTAMSSEWGLHRR